MWKIVYRCYRCGEFIEDNICSNCGVLDWHKLKKENIIFISNRAATNKAHSYGYIPKYYKDEEGCIWELSKPPHSHKQRRKFVANRKRFYKKIKCNGGK